MPFQWVHQTGTAVLALAIPIPTTTLEHGHLAGVPAEQLIHMSAMHVRPHGTRRHALRTHLQMVVKLLLGTHRRGRPTLMPTVGRRRLGMRARGHPATVVDGVVLLQVGRVRQVADGEGQHQGGHPHGVAAIVGVVTPGYADLPSCVI